MKYLYLRLKGDSKFLKDIDEYRKSHSQDETTAYANKKYEIKLGIHTLRDWKKEGVFDNLDSSESSEKTVEKPSEKQARDDSENETEKPSEKRGGKEGVGEDIS